MLRNDKRLLRGWGRQTAFAALLVSSMVLFGLAGSAGFGPASSEATLSASPVAELAPQQNPVPLIDVDGIDRFAGSPLTWFDDYESAREIARLTKKPLFVVIRCER